VNALHVDSLRLGQNGEEENQRETIVEVSHGVHKRRIALFDYVVEFVAGLVLAQSACCSAVASASSPLEPFNVYL